MSDKQKRRSVIANGDGGIDGVLATTIRNGEDLCPIVRHAFEVGKPELLLNQLKSIVKRKEIEIEELCKVHYEEFILAVDELRGVLSDADELKIALSAENSRVQDVASSLLSKLEDLLALYSINKNVAEAVNTLSFCIQVLILCSKCNSYIEEGSFHLLVKALGVIETDYVQRIPIKALKRVIERQIPAIRSYIEKKACSDFNDWLVRIRQKAREIGQIAVGHAASMRQRDADLRKLRREAEEQSSCVYALDVEQIEGGPAIKFDLLPVYRAYHVYTCLGLEERFQKYYFDNRLLQLNLDLEVSTAQSFLESHQGFFSQITGFFIVEDGVLRTASKLLSHSQLEAIWDAATSKITSLLEEQFSSMEIASHFLMIKDYVSLLCATLKCYGYEVSPLLHVLDKGRDRYHELLISEFRKRVTDALENDTHEQMVIRKEYEYGMNVLAFNLHISEIMPAFPYVAPFSASVPQICRVVRCFIEDSVNYLSYSSHVNLFDAVRKYLDRFLSDVLNEAIMKIIHSGTLSVSPAMQITANIAVLENACDHFLKQTAQLCEIPVRFIQRAHGSLAAQALLRATHNAAYIELSNLLRAKIDEFMDLANNIKWTAEDPPQTTVSEYINVVCIYLDTLISTALEIFPPDTQHKIASVALQHISDSIVATFLSESVKKFNINAVVCLDIDLRSLESFVDEKLQNGGWNNVDKEDKLRECLTEARQLVNLLMSNQPDNFMNPVIREKNYGALDYKKVACICDKFKDSSDTLFGSLSSRNSKQSARKKSMDTLKRRLREFS
ncbi:exocyst complex component sec15A [Wolffia australiana]